MDQNIKIAVLGGGGRTGKYVVKHLLSKGYQLKILLRNIPEISELTKDEFTSNLTHPLAEIVKGDAVLYEDIRRLLSGCDAVISTIGQRPGEPMVAGAATKNVLQVMEEFSIQRYIVVAGVNVDTPFDKKSEQTKAATNWMKENFPATHEDRAKAYHILAKSQLDWTLVRLPMIEYSSENFLTDSSTEDCLGQQISTADIAFFLEEQLTDKRFIRKSPFLYNLQR